MRYRNGFWGKARAGRPSIYRRPGLPSFRKGMDVSCDTTEFRRFFEKFVEKIKIPRNPDIFDLHALIAKSSWGLEGDAIGGAVTKNGELRGAPMQVDTRLSGLLALSIVSRSILQGKGMAGGEATGIVMDAVEGVDVEDFGKLRHLFRNSRDRVRMEEAIRMFTRELCRVFGGRISKEWIVKQLFNKLLLELDACLSLVYARKLDIMKYAGLPRKSQLFKFWRFVEQECSSTLRRFFRYPSREGRLWAILGDVFVPNPCGSEIEETEKKVNGGSQSFAAVLMYPWEADHLAKAREMKRRGLYVAKPAAKIITSGVEFALFRWVKGASLARIGDSGPWEDFGKTLRIAHGRGVALDDAAGRNAVWDGKKTVLIDFEHTWLNRSGKPLDFKDRERALLRVVSEAERKGGGCLDAFERGYGDREAMLEVQNMLGGDKVVW